jgi:hypothetical protein
VVEEERVTEPSGGRSQASPGSTGRPPAASPPRPPSGPPPLRVIVGLPVALAGLVAVVVAAYLVGDRQGPGTQPSPTPSTANARSLSELEGEWSGEGSLTHCAGFDDEGCPGTLPVTLTIDCSKKRCAGPHSTAATAVRR